MGYQPSEIVMAAKLLNASLIAGSALSVSARTCQPAYNADIDYVGCYHDPNSPRDLAGPLLTVGNLNSPQYCADICGASGFAYSGVEYTV